MNENIRDYEVSIWTLQDSYKATLKWFGASHKGLIQDPKMKISDDGTEEFTFSIPMYLMSYENGEAKKIENPIWYTVEEGIIVKNMRKIKVIFNKTFDTTDEDEDEDDDEKEKERIFEFLITKVEETHENENTTCDVTCEGLAFHELGKQGFKLELSSDLFYERCTLHAKYQKWYDNNWNEHTEGPPRGTIDYWMHDIGIKNIEEYTTDSPRATEWTYKVDMNYESYAYADLRDSKKIYTEQYVKSWDDNLHALEIAPYEEKERMVDSQESNIYNLTLTIAETFGVFCRYEYGYDDNYHIISRTIVFYNNFVKDHTGEIFEDLTYPYSATQVSREYDATDITTKMFVRPEENESSSTGYISIMDTSANKTGEDFILDFHYLYDIGTITQELYEAIDDYENVLRELNYGNSNDVAAAKALGKGRTISIADDGTITVSGSTPSNDTAMIVEDVEVKYNNGTWSLYSDDDGDSIQGLIDLLEILIKKEDEKIDVEAKLTTVTNELTNAKERMADAALHIGANNRVDEYDASNPLILVASHDSSRKNNTSKKRYWYSVSFNTTGINGILPDSIHLYKKWDSNGSFPVMKDLNVPEKTKLSRSSWADLSSSELNVITKYALFYKKAHKNTEFSYTVDGTTKTGEAAVKLLFKDWLTEFDADGQLKLGMPNTVSQAVCTLSTKDTSKYVRYGTSDITTVSNQTYDIFNDSVAWIAYFLGKGTVDKVTIKNKKKKVIFSGYILKKIIVNVNGSSKTYQISSTAGGKITAESWNYMVMARRAFCAQYKYGIGMSGVSALTTSSVTIAPVWKTESQSPDLTVAVYNAGNILWGYGPSGSVTTSPTLRGLWNEIKPGFNSLNIKCFDQFVGYFGADWGTNELTKFTIKYDSNNNVVGATGIFSSEKLDRIYAILSFNESTYYASIVNMWYKKICVAVENEKKYSKELNKLETIVDLLEYQIRTRLLKKFAATAKFNLMMGPALRESYWLPEDYSDYGDVYRGFGTTGTTATISFTNNMTEPTDSDKIRAALYWDSTLNSSELKAYYETGVNLTLVYYPCIDLKAFLQRLELQLSNESNSIIAQFLSSDINQLCFLFYNDSFDRESYSSNHWSLDNDDIVYAKTVDTVLEWYYKRTITYGTEEFNDEITIERVEADKQSYMMNASMQLAFIKRTANNNSSIIPVLMMTGLDALDRETLHFICCLSSSTVADNNGLIRPGAQPTLGFWNGTVFSPLGVVLPDDWLPLVIWDTDIDVSTTISSGLASKTAALQINDMVASLQNGTTSAASTTYSSLALVCADNLHQTVNNSVAYEAVYPRITINSLEVRKSDMVITANNVLLNEYEDYYILSRNTNTLITLKPNAIFANYITGANPSQEVNVIGSYLVDGNTYMNPPLNIYYKIINGGTFVYLDALEIMEENSVPKVSYSVKPNVLSTNFINTLYNKLGQIVHINDAELKFENVFGYISELDLDLDLPWEDSIEVKNYKNKFEDLFSSISAQTEEMKKNGGILASLCSGVLSDGLTVAVNDALKETTAEAITEVETDSSYLASIILAYLDSHFDGVEVVTNTLDEIFKDAAEILASGEDAISELNSLNNSNAAILGSFVENITSLVTPTIKYISSKDALSSLTNYKAGDIFVDNDGNLYIAGSGSNIFQFYDGSTSKITGASIDIDAEAGTIDILGGSNINIKSGDAVTIAAETKVNIIGNEEVNIGGCTINIGSGRVGPALPVGPGETDDGVYYTDGDSPGGINIIASSINDIASATSGVFISAELIKMVSSDIIMKGAQRISMYSSGGELAGTDTSVIYIDKNAGIYIGTGTEAGINLYGGLVQNANGPVVDPVTGAVTITTKATVSINKNRILMGVGGTGNSVVRIKEDEVVIASNGGLLESNGAEIDGPEVSGTSGLIGAKFTAKSIGFATTETVNNSTITNAILMDSTNGITLGSGASVDVTAASSAIKENTSNNYGSYVRINKEGIILGSTADLYINTNNFKLLTNRTDTTTLSNNSTVPGTVFAVGSNLLSINKDTDPSALTGSSTVNFLVNLHGAYINGTVYATSLKIKNNSGTFETYSEVIDGKISSYVKKNDEFGGIEIGIDNNNKGYVNIGSSGTVSITGGGKLIVSMTNFGIDSSGNVAVTGEITASKFTAILDFEDTSAGEESNGTGYILRKLNTNDIYGRLSARRIALSSLTTYEIPNTAFAQDQDATTISGLRISGPTGGHSWILLNSNAVMDIHSNYGINITGSHGFLNVIGPLFCRSSLTIMRIGNNSGGLIEIYPTFKDTTSTNANGSTHHSILVEVRVKGNYLLHGPDHGEVMWTSSEIYQYDAPTT